MPKSPTNGKSGAAKPALSPRELECLRLLAEGDEDQRIADKLGIATRTVRYHVERAKRSLSAKNRIHCIALAFRLKLID